MAARKKYAEKRMPFLGHLEELRWHIFRSIISVFIFTIVFYLFSEQLIDFFTKDYPGKLIALAPTDLFMIRVKTAFFVALIASIPVVVREIWAFIAPGLLEQERKHIPMIVFLTSFCFIVGASFAFFVVFPLTIKFLMSFETESMAANWTINKYLGFVSQMLLGFGIVFELPMLAMFLTRIGLITPQLMKKYRSYAIVSIFIIAAIITPSTDATTQLALAGPLLVLYEISIFLSKFIQKKRREREEQEEREYDEELRQEAAQRRARTKAAAESKELEIKKWETEGDHYEESKTTTSSYDESEMDDMYPYDMDPMHDDYHGDPYEMDYDKPPGSEKAASEDSAAAGDESPDSNSKANDDSDVMETGTSDADMTGDETSAPEKKLNKETEKKSEDAADNKSVANDNRIPDSQSSPEVPEKPAEPTEQEEPPPSPEQNISTGKGTADKNGDKE